MRNILKRLKLIGRILFSKRDDLESIEKTADTLLKEKELTAISKPTIFTSNSVSEVFIDKKGLSQVIALKNEEILTFSKFGLITLFDERNMTLKLELNLESEWNEKNWKLLQGGNCCIFIQRKNIIVAISRYYLDFEDSEYGGPEKFIIYWIDKATFKIIKKEKLKYPVYDLFTSTTESYLIGRTINGIVYFNIDTLCFEKKIDLTVNNKIFIDDYLKLLITCYSENFPFNKNIKLISQDDYNIIGDIKGFDTGSIDAITYTGIKRWIAIYSTGEKLIKIFDLDSNSFSYSVPISYNESDIPVEMKFSNEADFLAVKLRHSVFVFETKTFDKLCDLKHQNKNELAPSKDGYIEDVSFFNYDKNILTTTSDGYLRVWK